MIQLTQENLFVSDMQIKINDGRRGHSVSCLEVVDRTKHLLHNILPTIANSSFMVTYSEKIHVISW